METLPLAVEGCKIYASGFAVSSEGEVDVIRIPFVIKLSCWFVVKVYMYVQQDIQIWSRCRRPINNQSIHVMTLCALQPSMSCTREFVSGKMVCSCCKCFSERKRRYCRYISWKNIGVSWYKFYVRFFFLFSAEHKLSWSPPLPKKRE